MKTWSKHARHHRTKAEAFSQSLLHGGYGFLINTEHDRLPGQAEMSRGLDMSRGPTSEDDGRRMLRREPPGRRSRRRPETGEMEDMKAAGVRKEDEEEEDSCWRLLKGERRSVLLFHFQHLSVCLSEGQAPRASETLGNLYSVGLMRLSFLKALKIPTKPQDLTSEVKHKRREKVESRVPPINSSQSAVHYG